MILARPADDEIETIILHAHDDLLDPHAHDPFARGDGRPFCMPGALDVGAERQELGEPRPRAARGSLARRSVPLRPFRAQAACCLRRNQGRGRALSLPGRIPQPRDEALHLLRQSSRRRRVAAEVIERIQPLGFEAALAALEERGREDAEKRRQIELALEQGRFEAAHARRQYDAVDPDNRLVAGELERRWNERLKEERRLYDELDALSAAPLNGVTDDEREALLRLDRVGCARSRWRPR